VTEKVTETEYSAT